MGVWVKSKSIKKITQSEKIIYELRPTKSTQTTWSSRLGWEKKGKQKSRMVGKQSWGGRQTVKGRSNGKKFVRRSGNSSISKVIDVVLTSVCAYRPRGRSLAAGTKVSRSLAWVKYDSFVSVMSLEIECSSRHNIGNQLPPGETSVVRRNCWWYK